MRIVVVGTGYVGLSLAVLLAQRHEVVALDIDEDRVAALREGHSPIADADIERFLAQVPLDLTPTTDAAAAYAGSDLVVVATPTDYDPLTNYFDTSSVESVVDAAASASNATIVIKSTVPVGTGVGERAMDTSAGGRFEGAVGGGSDERGRERRPRFALDG
ncbi:MAG: UDP-glucose/GDP-mannose dehydrogenase family protein [Salana multivorans]|nr:UDP-glucose/GDP-mannose dehydrogenase family protein [Salana multivorans]